jgi:chromosome segregation protein
MRIKQIELNGFKSFMERTVLELPPGVTAIVGPNGCGKSNIVDAIRWVLGEQSPKHLRGSAMEDVVFAGNADNGPLGMAEVSLLLERSDEDLLKAEVETAEAGAGGDGLPPELAKASEILVTRRYFRSGESEYFINQAPCRLKDITELFLGTGVGTKAYAIIEQGRVEQLVNAKPEELRHFIEEAAGTTRFRARKVAAERKMERTRDNLLRVQDVVRELERQMSSLQRQAKRAEEYHRLKDELRALDLRVLATRQRGWAGEIAALETSLAAIHEEEHGLVAAMDRRQASTDAARAARHETETQLRSVDEELTNARLRATEMLARAQAALERRAELDRRVAAADVETARLRQRHEETEARRQACDVECADLAVARRDADDALRRAEERLRELDATGGVVEQELEQSKDALVDALSDEARLRNLAEALERRRAELHGQRARLDEEQRALGARLDANAREREFARAQAERLNDERERVTREREILVQRRAEHAAEERRASDLVETARDAVTQLASRADSLRELQARFEGCTRGTASLLGRADGGQLLADVLRVPAELERAVAAALGVRLQQIVVPSTQGAVDAIRWLRSSEAGTATALPSDPERRAAVIVPAGRRLVDALQVDPQHWALAEALLGNVLVADDLDAALALWRDAAHPVTVVTVTGEAIDALGAVTGGSEAPLEETLLARARELREIEVAITAARERLREEAGKLDQARADVEAATAAVTELDARLQALRLADVAGSKDRERLEDERTRITAELEVGALEASGLAGADGEVSGELAAMAARAAEATRRVVDARAMLAARQHALTAWREELAMAERLHTEQAVRSTQAAERCRAADTARSVATDAACELAERLRDAETLRSAGGEAIIAAERDHHEADSARAEAVERAEVLGEERRRLTTALSEADVVLSAEDHEERAARHALEALRNRRVDCERELTERRFSMQGIHDRLLERYGVGVEVLDDVPAEEAVASEEDASRAEDIRARIARLGDVNPGALAEYDEVRQRYEFLTQQRSDLERSLEDLRQTIAKLTRTSRQRFDETFAAANLKLAEVFPKVFPGGVARLDLVPGEDGGEAGVEIVVQPAGKKLQSLSLLSGGEKALTATALVFSLFLIRPTPFCLLDEVDAPLDEANIGRFNQIVQDMAEGSQFVLITHNRRTMEAADTLYGITMEKAGVSKVVSVRLREAA